MADKEFFETIKLNPDEKKIMDNTKYAHTQQNVQADVAASILLSRRIEEAAEKLVKSNERIASSNEYYAKEMKKWTMWLAIFTAALVLVGLMQAGFFGKIYEFLKSIVG